MTKVKICGITNLEDALLSAKFGADALGFNFYEKSPRYISPEKARGISEQLPAEVLKVGVFVNDSLDKIIEIAETAKLDAIQLHGEETPEFVREIKAKTNLEIIKAFRVSLEFKAEDVLKYEVDAVLLDAYSSKEHGGTGETFDWEIAKKVQEIFPKMYLAGGLSETNIIDAVKIILPYSVDICSSIEKQKGKKDQAKINRFMQKVKNFEKINWEISKENWESKKEILKDRQKLAPEWKEVIRMFEARISDRYFQTIEDLINKEGKSKGEGFGILTLQCSIMEYLGTLKDGMIFNHEEKGKKTNYKKKIPTKKFPAYYYTDSAKWYNKFLNTATIFEGYFHGEKAFLKSHDFYQNVRCGLIHEAQTRNNWTVHIYKKSKSKDRENNILFENKKIYRTALNRALNKWFEEFCKDALRGNNLGRRYRKYIARKLDVIFEIKPDKRFFWW